MYFIKIKIMKNVLTVSFIFFLFFLLIVSCRYRPESKPQTDALALYKQGLGQLACGELLQAELSLKKAARLNQRFAPADEGLARVYLQRGRLNKAQTLAEKAWRKNKRWLPTRLVKARIFLAESAFELCRDELRLALKQMADLKLPHLKAQTYLILGQSYIRQRQFAQAATVLKKALNFNPDLKAAQIMLKDIQANLQFLRFRSPAERKIAAKTVCTRADLAKLLKDELSGFQRPAKSGKQVKATDVNPADTAVNRALQNGWLPILPDGTFRPNDKVDRAEMALFAFEILKKFDTDSLLKQGFGHVQKSPFNDVRPVYPYFTAALAAVRFGVLKTDAAGNFSPQAFTDGLQALHAVVKLKEIIADPSSLPFSGKNKTH